jgi:hypothetical protein
MKTCLVLALALISSIGMGVELHHASNSQLISELERRLGGGVGPSGATAMYSCDSSYRLNIELLSPVGGIQKETVYIGDEARCDEHLTLLNANKTRIGNVTVAAVCDSSMRLKRFSLLSNGTFGGNSDIYVGDIAKCMAQMKIINSSN